MTTLFFAPYFQIANEIFQKMLFGKEFTAVPDNIEGDTSMITLYDGKCNVNAIVMKTIVEKTNFDKVIQ